MIESFDLAVQRYGRPDGVMTDRGSAFHSWKGLSRFEALLEDYEINYYLAKRQRLTVRLRPLTQFPEGVRGAK